MAKSPDAFRTISEVAEWLDTPAHVLRFWESRFSQVKPIKRAGGRRYYRPADMLLLGGIKKLLHEDGMTIKGAQKMLRTAGIKKVSALSQPLDTHVSDDNSVQSAQTTTDEPAKHAEKHAAKSVAEDETGISASTKPEADEMPDIVTEPDAKQETLTALYSRLTTLHDRMKANIAPKQQG